MTNGPRCRPRQRRTIGRLSFAALTRPRFEDRRGATTRTGESSMAAEAAANSTKEAARTFTDRPGSGRANPSQALALAEAERATNSNSGADSGQILQGAAMDEMGQFAFAVARYAQRHAHCQRANFRFRKTAP